MHCLLPLCKLPTIFCWKHVWINFTISRTGDGATNSLPIKPRDGGQVESHPSVILSGKQHGSGPITSQNQPEGNPSPNITTFCDQVVAPPWPKGYGPSICFALSLFCRMVKFLWLQIQNNYGDNWIALCCLGAENTAYNFTGQGTYFYTCKHMKFANTYSPVQTSLWINL